MIRVAVGIPLYGYVPAYVYYRHIKWMMDCAAAGIVHGVVVSESCYLPWGRRNIIRDAIQAGYTHVFFVDQDVTMPVSCVVDLMASRKPIIGALYYQKIKPHVPVAGYWKTEERNAWKPVESVKSGIMRVDVVGMGATLLDLKIFKTLGVETAFDMNAECGEDVLFCRRAQDAGFQIWIDPRIDTEHVGATPITKAYYVSPQT